MAASKNRQFASKKCPHCSIYLPVAATRCTSCKQKVGPPDKYGIAKKPVDVKAYIVAALSIAALGYYIWWAFLKE